jgi:uncharacterized protein (TIGR03382 family)
MICSFRTAFAIARLTPFLATPALAQGTYTVFDWEGMTAPTEPSNGSTPTVTTYTGLAQYWDGTALSPTDLTIRVTPLTYLNPATWGVDGSSMGNTYGYQSPDEAEFRFGTAPNGLVQFRFELDLAQPVNNAGFFILDIDNNSSDHITGVLARSVSNDVYYPSLSLVAGSTVTYAGSGATLDAYSNGGNSTDTQALGSAYYEWQSGIPVQHIEFVWSATTGTSIRFSNLYAYYDPPAFNEAVPGSVPEPGTALLGLLGLAVLLRRRR